MPPELAQYLPQIISLLAGLFFGWLCTWLAGSGKMAAAAERLKSAEIEARLAHSTAKSARSEKESQTFRNQLTSPPSGCPIDPSRSRSCQRIVRHSESTLEIVPSDAETFFSTLKNRTLTSYQ